MKRALAVSFALVALAGLGLVGFAYQRASHYDLRPLLSGPVVRTALMRQREAEARDLGLDYVIDHRWVAYAQISPLLRHAVLTAEDDAFFRHRGLDWSEIRASARRNLEEGRLVRGGSTITQQLARNLFLGAQRTPLRKLEEVFLAMRLERALPKQLILALYLNLIEWGDGVFGVEAAARRDFGLSAADLDPRQALLLAAVIINPIRYSPQQPSSRIERRVRIIASRMHRRGDLDDRQYAEAIGEASPMPGFLQWLFGTARRHAPELEDTLAPDSGAGRGIEEPEVAPVDSAAGEPNGW